MRIGDFFAWIFYKMCVDYYVDNVDNVETKLHIMFIGNPKNAEN